MSLFVRSHKIIFSFVFVAFSVFSSKLWAQTFAFNVTPSSQCFSGPSSPGTAFVTVTPTTAVTNYTWAIAGSSCTPTFSNSVSNGSVITVSYPCCGSYTFYCSAMNGSTLVAGNSLIIPVFCSPILTISSSPTLCAGSTTTLSASGAQSYTWSNSNTGNQIIVSPSVSTTYSVIGANASGCSDSASVTPNVIPLVFAGYTYSSMANGLVMFSNTSVNTTSNTTYFWNFGNSVTSTSVSPSITYTSNGSYTVTLTANSSCSANTFTQTINISNITGPPCVASFSFQAGTAGNYSFTSTSTGTSSLTLYIWKFGNGAPTYSASGLAGITPPPQNYSSGNYFIKLYISSSNPFCSDSAVVYINACSLNANYSYIQTIGNTISFTNTSTGTLTGTNYLWNLGDGNTSTGLNSAHSYSSSGSYIVSLNASNSSTCNSSVTKTVVVSGCNLVSNFTHTVLTNGVVQFSGSSSTTNSNSNYYWNFGDGIYSLASSPTHTYVNAGAYLVTLKLQDATFLACFDSLTQAINVTGISCIANPNFIVVPTFSASQNYIAIPEYPYNVTAAIWYWGDGTTSNSLYASHLYSVAANYSICLSVTVSCGATSYTCFANNLNKSNDNPFEIIQINVMQPEMSTGILNTVIENLSYKVFPNPSNGEFSITLPKNLKGLSLLVYNLVGELVQMEEIRDDENKDVKTVNLKNVKSGIYFVKLSNGLNTFTRKIVISN
ncbi:PKD domain-containing protein [Aurantibacillus circumpalustris]|uniref:PKD domain-containing protein n=1 Tax=Aurantibacillus circumpalustris TaxID=3036359 RepID=UPI00295B47B5|nr:PKD domain-containing protein [Aurantibacillus circumpalustris]